MTYQAINFAEKLGQFSDFWSPRVIAELNDYQLKLVKIEGEFVWHAHAATDEVFIVLEGAMTIHFRDGLVTLNAGEMFVVPKGVDHKPASRDGCQILLIEPSGVINTGESGGDKTAPQDVWI